MRGKNSPSYRHGESKGSLANCVTCRAFFVRRKYRQRYCSRTCELKHQIAIGLKDMRALGALSWSKTNNRLVEEGIFGFQLPEARLRAALALQEKSRGGTNIERRVRALLESKRVRLVPQYPIQHGTDTLGRPRYYFVDFYLADHNAIIECDGTRWHTGVFQDRHDCKDDFLRYSGYKVLHLTDFDVNERLPTVSKRIDEFLDSIGLKIVQ